MSKFNCQALTVIKDGGGRPLRVGREGKWVEVVAVLDRWHDTGCWWEGESPKLFFRLQLKGERVWEVFLDLEEQAWRLYKIYD